MQDLLKYLIKGITGNDNFEIDEVEEEDGRVNLTVTADKADMGIIIGKAGNTIKSIQNILRIKGTVENKYVHLTVKEL